MLPITSEELEPLSTFPFPTLSIKDKPLSTGEFHVYLAGPFFNIGQRWLLEESLGALQAIGLKVFSPLHEIGLGDSHEVAQQDLDGLRRSRALFALVDGLDAGTMLEVGYARSLGKSVVVLAESTAVEPMLSHALAMMSRSFSSFDKEAAKYFNDVKPLLLFEKYRGRRVIFGPVLEDWRNKVANRPNRCGSRIRCGGFAEKHRGRSKGGARTGSKPGNMTGERSGLGMLTAPTPRKLSAAHEKDKAARLGQRARAAISAAYRLPAAAFSSGGLGSRNPGPTGHRPLTSQRRRREIEHARNFIFSSFFHRLLMLQLIIVLYIRPMPGNFLKPWDNRTW